MNLKIQFYNYSLILFRFVDFFYKLRTLFNGIVNFKWRIY